MPEYRDVFPATLQKKGTCSVQNSDSGIREINETLELGGRERKGSLKSFRLYPINCNVIYLSSGVPC